MTPREALAMTDRLVHTSGIRNDDQNALFEIKENFERILITQKSKKTYVTTSNVFYRRDIIFMYRNISFSLKDIELSFQNKVIFHIFVSFAFMSYNPDTGIKDPHFSLKL